MDNVILFLGHHGAFKPFPHVPSLRRNKRVAADPLTKKTNDIRNTKSAQTNSSALENAALGSKLIQFLPLNHLRNLSSMTLGQTSGGQTSSQEFASIFETCVSGHPAQIRNPEQYVYDRRWTVPDLKRAIRKLKLNNAAGRRGLVAASLVHVPDGCFVFPGCMERITDTIQLF